MTTAGTLLSERHESTKHLMTTLQPNPRLDGIAADIALRTWDYAAAMCDLLADGPELSAGLRKIREGKDAFVIQALLDSGAIARPPGLYPRTHTRL